MFVPLRRTHTWRLHTKLLNFGWHSSANSKRMENISCPDFWIYYIDRLQFLVMITWLMKTENSIENCFFINSKITHPYQYKTLKKIKIKNPPKYHIAPHWGLALPDFPCLLKILLSKWEIIVYIKSNKARLLWDKNAAWRKPFQMKFSSRCVL